MYKARIITTLHITHMPGFNLVMYSNVYYLTETNCKTCVICSIIHLTMVCF